LLTPLLGESFFDYKYLRKLERLKTCCMDLCRTGLCKKNPENQPHCHDPRNVTKTAISPGAEDKQGCRWGHWNRHKQTHSKTPHTPKSVAPETSKTTLNTHGEVDEGHQGEEAGPGHPVADGVGHLQPRGGP
jgi:hypothetical protein